MPPPRGRFAVASKPTGPSKAIGCCKMTFSSDQAYENHLLNSANHFACKYCLVDHRTAEGLKRHMNQVHAAEQKLECIGCKRTFNRAGGLVGHIQLKECTYLKSGYIEELKANDPRASGMFDLIREATSWEGAEHRKLDDQLQLIDPSATNSQITSKDASSFETSVQERAVVEEEDLISFDTDTAASMIMNAPWDQPAVKFNKDVDFPTLTPISNNVAYTPKVSGPPTKSYAIVPHGTVGKSTASMHKQHNSVTHIPKELNNTRVRAPATAVSSAPAAPAWDTISSNSSATTAPAPTWGTTSSQGPASTALFRNAPAIAPPAALLESLSIDNTPPEPMYGEHHPENPNFNAGRYYNKYSQKYKCPHSVKCKDKESVTAFIQHLLSPIHQDHEKVTCQRCLRVFVNATAFVQHFESQAIRCDARTLGNAGEVVREIAQVVTTEGERHEDETVKYINTPGLVFNPQDAVAGMGEASRQAARTRAMYQKDCWQNKTYTNW